MTTFYCPGEMAAKGDFHHGLLAIEPGSWRGPSDPGLAFYTILDGLLNRDGADHVLIEQLSTTPLADLGMYANRSLIWSCLESGSLDRLLSKTARGWLQEAGHTAPPFLPEHRLQDAILKDRKLEQVLDALVAKRLGAAVRIVRILDGYGQHQFLALLKNAMSAASSLSIPAAEAIGQLVLERWWKEVAAELASLYTRGRRDLKPALRTCYRMFGWWDRFALAIRPVLDHEKWDRFQELAAQLYPEGPDALEVWERAGGANAELPTTGEGRTRWRRAVRNVRNGKSPTPAALLTAMMEDYPNNEQLPLLAEDRLFEKAGPGRRRKSMSTKD